MGGLALEQGTDRKHFLWEKLGNRGWGVGVGVYTGEKGQIGSLESSLGNCPTAEGVEGLGLEAVACNEGPYEPLRQPPDWGWRVRQGP